MDQYEESVKYCVDRALKEGCQTFHDVLSACEGADPKLVLKCCSSLIGPVPAKNYAQVLSKLLAALPAPDPALGQWWYTPDTQENITKRTLSLKESPRVLCLGAPTVSGALSDSDCTVTVIDADPDVVTALQKTVRDVNVICADLLTESPTVELVDVAIVDPPWYPAETKRFLHYAVQNLRKGGQLLLTLPPMLTRPGIHLERQDVLDYAKSLGMEFVSLDANAIRYVVPRFEEVAFSSLSGFCGRPWRVADLLFCRRDNEIETPPPSVSSALAITQQRFSHDPCEFRVFVGPGPGQAEPRTIVQKLPSFSENVSRRAHGGKFPDVWTSEKAGILVEDLDEALFVIASWQSRCTMPQTIENLKAKVTPGLATKIVEAYDAALGLWSNFFPNTERRTSKQILQHKRNEVSQWATLNSNREHDGDDDGFRIAFARDRDRILWSGSFRQLSGKTQLFPVDDGVQLRQRLAHSIEVMQLASTIGESFGLDGDLIEAGALAHDIGHTPFGHAGEHALDQLFLQLGSTSNVMGFNHYEHGVDIVRYLEGPYQYCDGKSHVGLNLTSEVSECIFKHTFCQGGTRISHDEIRKLSKHQDYLKQGYCHLEGQAVRIADKISYLISDLEDGIRLNAISEEALQRCRLFQRPPIDMTRPKGESLLNRFLVQRRNVIKVLMEDVITASGRRLARTVPGNVRSHDEYCIDHSDTFRSDVSEIWQGLQAAQLHKDSRVVRANLRAAKIVSELCLLTAILPELVPISFHQEHKRLWSGPYMRYYHSTFGSELSFSKRFTAFLPLDRYIGKVNTDGNCPVRIEWLVQAKDYIASMTDAQATTLHTSMFG